MRLTKLQRHTAYILILLDAEDKMARGQSFCLCWSISEIAGVLLSSLTTDAQIMFPEYWEKRTIKGDCLWFKSTSERIEALKQCISETY